MKKRILGIFLALLMIFSTLGINAEGTVAEAATEAAADVAIKVTVSLEGVLATAKDGSAMLGKTVTAKDINEDGKITVDEALTAAHDEYYDGEGGYASSEKYGSLSATKLWGESGGFLMFRNNAGISGVGTEEVSEGDVIVASVLKDNTTWSDWYSFFDKTEVTVVEDEELTLTLKGHYGMAYTDEDKTDVSLSGISIGTWNEGEFVQIGEKQTDEDGKVTLSFDKAGTYYVTASGTVRGTVEDWSTGSPEKKEKDCPIIAPGCIVTVTEKSNEEMSDSDALDKIYSEFSNTSSYGSSTKTPLLFPLEYEGETYENVIDYLKAWAKKETGRELTVDYTYVNGASSYNAWESGYISKVTLLAFDENGDIVSDYFKDNEPAYQRLSNVYFTVGNKKSDRIASIWVRTKSKERTDEEIADYLLTQLPFSRIQGTNESQNQVVTALGSLTQTTKLSVTDMLYSSAKASISWSAACDEGREDALTITYDEKAKKYITKVSRPNVGEDDAKFTLTATVTAGECEKTKDFDITVPAFSEEKISLKVTEGATFKLTDDYYGKAVDEKYIKKEDNAPEGFDLYTLSLHTGASGGSQTYKYTAEKEGFLTESGTFSVTGDNDGTVEIGLSESTESDARLKSLEIVNPTVSGLSFSPEKTEYEIDVKGASSFSINASTFSSKATAKITKYYATQKNADKTPNPTVSTNGNFSKGAVTCYIPSNEPETTVEITVTAPEGSVQAEKEVKYTITAKKTEKAMPLTGLVLKASGNGQKNNVIFDGADNEEVLSPSFISGAREEEYRYTVNYFMDKVTVKPTSSTSTSINVNGAAVTSGKESKAIPLSVGDNEIIVSVTEENVTTDYKIIVHRKEKLILTDVTIAEGELLTELKDGGTNMWSGSASFDCDAKEIHVTYTASSSENVTIIAVLNGTTYTAASGEEIVFPVENKEKITPKLSIVREKDGIYEAQSYTISFTRGKSYHPDSVQSYLPAPGQFVNLGDSWGNPKLTLTAKAGITLGAFGGNVVYKYDEPIKNDPKNPYGIDFIIKGNCFTDTDGTTSSGAAEPAAVMVSADGKKWYELAGSEYYTASARHNIDITYKNIDTTFSAAAKTPWITSDDESGTMPVNEYHSQAYYPNPEYYNSFQAGIGKNTTYKAESVSFTGTMIDYGFYPFGYADSHSANDKMFNAAVNPYSENHKAIYNGDGFDLSWAVDENGTPVKLNEISYIKIYNPVLSYGTSRGEISPEILSVSRAKANDNAVGVTEGLSALFVNGEEIPLKDGKFTYEADAKGAALLKIKAVSSNDKANIYISNKRTASGVESAPFAAVEKVRIIVQEGEKEPLIYIINLSNIPKNEDNAKLLSLTLTPGDEKIEPNEENEISFTVESGVSAIRFTPVMGWKKATAVLRSEGTEDEDTVLKNGKASELIKIKKGENTFKIKVISENGENTEEYTVTVTRKTFGSSSDTSNGITVKFSLTGDIIHYENGKKHTEKTWIAQKTVTVPKGSTVKYLTEMMLNNAGISYVSDGIYISEINSLAEFDNGRNSGWMFRCNGLLGDEAYSEKILSNGDVIKWFYTDDYTEETGYENGWDKVNSHNGSASSKDEATESKEEKEEKTDEAKSGGTVIFKDVEKDAWYFNAVVFATEKKLFKGVSDESFAPDEFMTRAMLATVLHRLSEEKKARGGSEFNDVLTDAWYFDAVTWASESGIVKGMGESKFAPNEFITREQLAVILFRYAALNGKSTENRASISAFSDSGRVSSWAELAMSWAVAEGLLKGTDEGTLKPAANATRAEVAEILMRFVNAL